MRTVRDKADSRCFGDGTNDLENCRKRWESYESSCPQHLHDVELFIRWDTYDTKDPGEKLEEAACLHMHLANQRDLLDNMTCEARDLVAVALMHYHMEEQVTHEDSFSRGSYLREIHNRWNHQRDGRWGFSGTDG